MAWEARGNQHYYYRKRRIGDRVVSDYIGAGPVAELVALADADERQRREAERQQWQAEQADDQELVKKIDGVIDLVRKMTACSCIAAGCRQHKRQWRYAANTVGNSPE